MSSRIPYCVTKKYSFTDETIWGHRRLFYPRSHVNQSMSWCNDGFLPYQEGWGWHGPMANCWSELCCRWGVREGNGLHKLRAVITRVHASSAGLCRQHASTHRYRDYLYMINWSLKLRLWRAWHDQWQVLFFLNVNLQDMEDMDQWTVWGWQGCRP